MRGGVIGSLTCPLQLIRARAAHVIWNALPGSSWIRIAAIAACSLSVAAAIAYLTERRACGRLQRLLFSLPLIGGPATAPRGRPGTAPSLVTTKL